MKKNFFVMLFLLLSVLSFSQLSSKEYNDLLTEARLLYEAKSYKDAAIAYSSALRGGGSLVTNGERFDLACSWAKAGLPDSAYMQLDIIAASANLNFEFIFDLIMDDDFLALHNDKRWKDYKRKISKISGHASEEFVTAIDFIKTNDYDSAFYHANIAAESKDLTFGCAHYMIINHYFLSKPEKGNFEKDKRMEELKNKTFSTLKANYMSASAFSNTIKSPMRLLIDGGHYNGGFAILAGTLRQCGFEVSRLEGKFDDVSLKNTDMLLISNPQPDIFDSLWQRATRANQEYRWSDAATQSAYTESEISVIEKWVRNGGSLFLILDHAPNGKAGGKLAAAFGIENRNVGTYDSLSMDPISDTTDGARSILFTKSKELIGKHPIVKGIDSITTYTGESLMGPQGSDVLLYLPATAYDKDWLPETREFRYRSAVGRSQAVAFNYRKGRVVMLGEAAITRPEFLSVSNRGNWKFILNILRWLAREKMD
jgi:hypothetical protein